MGITIQSVFGTKIRKVKLVVKKLLNSIRKHWIDFVDSINNFA